MKCFRSFSRHFDNVLTNIERTLSDMTINITRPHATNAIVYVNISINRLRSSISNTKYFFYYSFRSHWVVYWKPLWSSKESWSNGLRLKDMMKRSTMIYGQNRSIKSFEKFKIILIQRCSISTAQLCLTWPWNSLWCVYIRFTSFVKITTKFQFNMNFHSGLVA